MGTGRGRDLDALGDAKTVLLGASRFMKPPNVPGSLPIPTNGSTPDRRSKAFMTVRTTATGPAWSGHTQQRAGSADAGGQSRSLFRTITRTGLGEPRQCCRVAVGAGIRAGHTVSRVGRWVVTVSMCGSFVNAIQCH